MTPLAKQDEGVRSCCSTSYYCVRIVRYCTYYHGVPQTRDSQLVLLCCCRQKRLFCFWRRVTDWHWPHKKSNQQSIDPSWQLQWVTAMTVSLRTRPPKDYRSGKNFRYVAKPSDNTRASNAILRLVGGYRGRPGTIVRWMDWLDGFGFLAFVSRKLGYATGWLDLFDVWNNQSNEMDKRDMIL